MIIQRVEEKEKKKKQKTNRKLKLERWAFHSGWTRVQPGIVIFSIQN